MIRRVLTACGAVVVLVGGAGSGPESRAVSAASAGDRMVGATDPTVQISFSVVLKYDDAALDRYLVAMTDRRSPRFRRSLSAQALGERFGPPEAVVREIELRLRSGGLRVVATYPQRTFIHMRGSVGAISRYLGVSYRDFVADAGIGYHAPVGNPELRLPARLKRWTAGVAGLSTKPQFRSATVRGGVLRPQDAALAYNVTPLHRRRLRGAGQTIAIASFATFEDGNIRRFDRRFRIAGPFPRHVPVDESYVEQDLEADLDVELVRAIAPEATVLNYEAANTVEGEHHLFDRILANRRVSVVSLSWGTCDVGLSPGRRANLERLFKDAATRGVNVFVASGDAGSYDCQAQRFSDHRLTVDFPGDSPNVISVGGTLLDVGLGDGRYLGEAGWEDVLSNGGGGGGVNPVLHRPSWQSRFNIPAPRTRLRAVPDVAAAASPASPWLIAHEDASGTWQSVGGTSAAAPFWAASMLLVQQFARQQGVGDLCFAAPMLYELAHSRQASPPFHDVTRGGNRHYRAHRGWDYATGLGSPNVDNLARAAVRYLRKAPRRCQQ